MADLPFKLSEGVQTNPAPLPLGGDELVFFSKKIGNQWRTVVATAKDIADLGMSQADVDALVALINARAPAVHNHAAEAVNTGVFAPERIPSLPIDKIVGLTSQLGGKSATGHTHTILEITGLRAELDQLWNAGGGGGGGGIGLPITITDVTGLRFELDDLGLAVAGRALQVHEHSADAITSGTLSKARLPVLGIPDVSGLSDALASAGSGVIDDGSTSANKVYSSQKVAALLGTKRDVAANVQSVVSAATVTPSFANDVVEVTALAGPLSVANPSGGTAQDGRVMLIRVKDDGTSRAITWGSAYVNSGAALPAATVAGKWLAVLCVRNNTAGQMQVIHAGVEGDAGATGGGTLLPPVIVNASVTLDASHLNRIIEHNDASPRAYTLPSGLGANGDIIAIVNNSGAQLTLQRSGTSLYKYGSNNNITIPARRSQTIYLSGTANVWYAL